MPEFRQNPLTGQWVIVSSPRAQRPQPAPEPTGTQASFDPKCPFCPGNERETPPELFAFRFDKSQPDTPGWTVRVVPNKYPATTMDAREVPTPESIAFAPKAQPTPLHNPGSKLCESQPAVGQHEVVVDSPAHDLTLAAQGDRQCALILDALRHRYRMLIQARDVKFVSVFKNHGRAAGATIEHPHFQVLAAAIVPPAAMTMLARSESFAKENGRPLFDVLLDEEQEANRRIVAANDEFVALAPWASQAPYELWIIPREPLPFFSDLSDDQIPLFAALLRDCLQRLDSRLSRPAYNLVIHSGPRMLRAQDHFRCFAQIIPRIGGLAGFELATGTFINPVAPEDVPAALRPS
jgi:UDPglucose--hexose-1-phosphate uridylyltransferase